MFTLVGGRGVLRLAQTFVLGSPPDCLRTNVPNACPEQGRRVRTDGGDSGESPAEAGSGR